MAKRRKENEEEEDKPFKVPKFDEESFLKRERRNIKTTFLAFLFACLMAFVCFGFWALIGRGNGLRWFLVFLVCIANATFIKFIFLRLNIDLTEFTKKNWFMTYGIYFFTWLLVFIVLVNPPFYDDEAPMMEVVALPEMQELGGDVLIVAKITDNTGVTKSSVTFTIDGNPILADDFNFSDNIFSYTYDSPSFLSGDETHNYVLSVKDSSGLVSEKTGSFSYSNDTIYLALPSNGDTVKAASDIKFGVQPGVWKVYYTVNDGVKINATQQSDRTDFYITSPEKKGWVPGEENVTVNVTAVVVHNFINHFLKDEDGNIIVDAKGNPYPYWFVNYINDTSSYTFDVADESMIGISESDIIYAPSARYVQVPGFEVILIIAAIAVVILIFKKKNKDEDKHK
jgi:hypothetical protein